ncbi:hypothetical protein F4778DRAFT_779542 [Xylariomycetidae sp. FL2044]|nr:hypothetical protein F4778DRAFT_779542 [Xylariomycetidae sp. FL2044]
MPSPIPDARSTGHPPIHLSKANIGDSATQPHKPKGPSTSTPSSPLAGGPSKPVTVQKESELPKHNDQSFANTKSKPVSRPEGLKQRSVPGTQITPVQDADSFASPELEIIDPPRKGNKEQGKKPNEYGSKVEKQSEQVALGATQKTANGQDGVDKDPSPAIDSQEGTSSSFLTPPEKTDPGLGEISPKPPKDDDAQPPVTTNGGSKKRRKTAQPGGDPKRMKANDGTYPIKGIISPKLGGDGLFTFLALWVPTRVCIKYVDPKLAKEEVTRLCGDEVWKQQAKLLKWEP